MSNTLPLSQKLFGLLYFRRKIYKIRYVTCRRDDLLNISGKVVETVVHIDDLTGVLMFTMTFWVL